MSPRPPDRSPEDGEQPRTPAENLYSVLPASASAALPAADTTPIMIRRDERAFEFDRPRLLEDCAQFTGATSTTDGVDIVRVRRGLIDVFDKWTEAPAGFASRFPGAEPRALCVALTLHRWWPTPLEQTDTVRREGLKLYGFVEAWAAMLAQSVVYAADLTQVYEVIDEIKRGEKLRSMPWKILEPVKRNPWPSVVGNYAGGDSGRWLVEVVERVTPDEIHGIPAEMKKVTVARDAVRAAQDAAGEMLLAVNQVISARAWDVMGPLNQARKEMEQMHQDLAEWSAGRPAKAPHHLEIFNRMGVEFARAIQALMRLSRAVAIEDRERPVVAKSSQPAGDAGGIFSKICVDRSTRLMLALYGVEMPARYLISRIQDWQESQLSRPKSSKERR